ncbi:neuropeptide SIFamide [Schistocerca nitens]|uniref:neuropeptide SIFamide n=1 Tax=Schistocerca nitens TaxID=7011 RepID=UPI0021174991|nr:neuropeptide SIFamide [Schistocerca nitens]
MQSPVCSRLLVAVVAALLVFAGTASAAAATFRRPPFNGSIFGKRNSVEYTGSSTAVSAVCEIAAEACAAWLNNEK